MPPTTTTSYHTLLSPLSHELGLLHLVFHRNRNQHHSSKWWKHLSILKRTLHKLTQQLTQLSPLPTSSTSTITPTPTLTKTQKKKLKKEAAAASNAGNNNALQASSKDAEIVKIVEAYLRHMRRVVVPSCYVAFTQVIATTQFSALGMILLAILGKIHTTIGPGSLEEQEQDRRKDGTGTWSRAEDANIPSKRRRMLTDNLDDEDDDEFSGIESGVVIEREVEDEEAEVIMRNSDDNDNQKVELERGQEEVMLIDRSDHFSSRKGDTTPPIISTKPSTPPTATEPLPEIDFFASTSTSTKLTTPKSISTALPIPTKRKSKKSDPSADIHPPTATTISSSSPPPKKKKKKSKKNAIDDLFAGLL